MLLETMAFLTISRYSAYENHSFFFRMNTGLKAKLAISGDSRNSPKPLGRQ